MLKPAVLEKLNEQVGHEFFSANLYLQMSSWCTAKGLEGCAKFLREHSTEEMNHMFRLFDYVNETGAQAVVPALEKPRHQFENVTEVFAATLEHEKFITSKINELVDVAFGEKDYSTFNFLQWYVAEQHEEEALFQRIVDMVNLVGTDGQGLYMLDREIGGMAGGSGTAAPEMPA
jgi:ferritin